MQQPAVQPLRYASFWKRLNAYGYDIIIVQLLALGPMFLFFSLPTLEDVVQMNPNVDHWFSAFTFLCVIVFATYNIYFVAGPSQATPGKKYCGIKVVMEDGSKPSLGQSAMRAVLPSVAMLMMAFDGSWGHLGWLLSTADGIWLVARPQRTALHDLTAQTRVILKEAA